MGLYRKAMLAGAAAGTLWMSALMVPVALDRRAWASRRLEVATWARDLRSGARVSAGDFASARVPVTIVGEGVLALGAPREGWTLRCDVRAGELVFQGCLVRPSRD